MHIDGGHTLEDGVHNPLLFRTTAKAGQVLWNGLVDLKQRSFLVNHMELVLVHELMITSSELSDCLIVLVQNGSMAMAVTIGRIVITLKAEQDVLTVPTGLLEVGCPDGEVGVSRPDEFAIVTHNVRSFLARAVELRLSPLARKRCHEQVTLLDILGGRDGDVQTRWSQVGPGFELPVCSCKGYQRRSASDSFKELHDKYWTDQYP